ncbi:GNAT family N-acetyltransferase [Micromonospora inositola]|uniref:GNAT family N-acetyltransferase n=1 Tax=Micromonospora inositola TaxID=47865 RepID=UPI000B5AC05B|nr:GNAT family N-acetyltransferase [Micromonospora inositola]
MSEVRIEQWNEGDLDLLRQLNAPEMGWAILPAYQGRGLATAAVRAVIAEYSVNSGSDSS